MKILYGVQGTGQGHISRARAIAAALRDHDVEVTWLFSGRPRERLFDMEPFGDFQYRRGLSFATHNGRISYLKTVTSQNIPRFLGEVFTLDVAPYDLVVTDYEPVTAWAARRAGVETIGIGHQYAFGAAVPVTGDNWLSRFIMTNFAPVTRPLGLHWHPYADHVLPPILDLPQLADEPGNEKPGNEKPGNEKPGDHILVYLPFEDQEQVSQWLGRFPRFRFRQYSADVADEERGNVSRRRANVAGFKRDLWRCRGVICNSGFELISECLHWRKPVLTRPLVGQMEQLSNALALHQLGYAAVMHGLDTEMAGDWLQRMPRSPGLGCGDVAAALARWLAGGAREAPAELANQLWRNPGAAVESRTGLPAPTPFQAAVA